MGIGSITMGILAFLCMLGGIVLSFVPFLGAMLSFLSPVLALIGIILGGVAMSQARQGGESESLSLGGLITSVIAFVPSMLVAVTCGLCNTCWTGVILTPHDAGPRPAIFPDAGSLWPSPGTVPAPPAVPGTLPAPGSWAPPPIVPPNPIAPTDPNAPTNPSAPTAPTDPAPTDPAAATPPAETAPTEAPPSDPAAPALPPPPLPPGPHVRP